MTPTAPIAWEALCPIPLFTDEVLAGLREVLDEPAVEEALARLDAAEEYPRVVLDRLRARGLGSVLAEDESGEPDRSRVTVYHICAMNALAARRDGTLAITLGVNSLALLPVYLAGSPEQLRRVFGRVREGAYAALLLTELDHGSNLLRNQASAGRGTLAADETFVPAPDRAAPFTHYRLAGEKHLINGGTRHDLLVSFLRTQSHPPEQALAARNDFTLFLVERDATIGALPRWRTLPTRGADISGVRFRGTVVPASCVIGAEGEGFGLVQKTLIVSRGGIGALASGAASRAWELALAHARTRDIYGGPILKLGAIADHLARLRALDLLAAALSVKAVAMVNAHGLGAAHFTAAAKLACCALAEEAVAEGRHVLAGRALLEDLPYARLVRDVSLYGVFDGTSHLMLDQLQWRLAQLAAGHATPSADPAADAAAAYARSPARLVEVLRRPTTTLLTNPAAAARSLAARGRSTLPLEPLEDLTRRLLEVVRALRSQKKWDPDQGLRFDAGGVLAGLEALLALAELADPGGRAALGLPAASVGPEHGASVRFAYGWYGARLVRRVRELALRAGLAGGAPFDDLEGAFVAQQANP
ncbi:MAG: acyl-CoA dehydrogenase family protein [Planctomycetes bacterium]|nr:acyl-CoA dehydrogenase family protein [Planctomycetota bacterium]